MFSTIFGRVFETGSTIKTKAPAFDGQHSRHYAHAINAFPWPGLQALTEPLGNSEMRTGCARRQLS